MAHKSKQPKTRRTNRFALFLLSALIVGMGIMLCNMKSQLDYARSEQAVYTQRLQSLQETNARLAADIANSSDPDLIADIARNELGMTAQGEKIFRFRN